MIEVGVRSTATASYILSWFNIVKSSCSPYLFSEVLESLRRVMGYSLSEDCRAGRVAFSVAYEAAAEKRLVRSHEVCDILRGRDVCVVGSAATLRREITGIEQCETIIAADGATAYLVNNGFLPDIIVSDGDGPLDALLRAYMEGSLLILYFHGDNYRFMERLTRDLEGFAVSAQCLPSLWGWVDDYLVLPATGFTDGDRAAWLAECCSARSLRMMGMDTRAQSLAGTKRWLKEDAPPGETKRAKLTVAEFLLNALHAKHGGEPWGK